MNEKKSNRLRDVPLWRLLVALADVENTVGPNSSTARTLASEIRERLKPARPAPAEREGADHAR